MTHLTTREREDLSLLLPWYVAGTLDEADTARVDAALERDPALRAELDIVLEDQAAALEVSAREEVPVSMEARFHAALENAISKESRLAAPAAGESGLLERIAGFFAPPRRLAFAAIAAALLIVAQGGAILSLVSGLPDGQPNYVTASGDKSEPAEGLFVLVRFADGASTGDVAAWLTAHDAHIVDGPLPGGMFRLRFSKDAADDSAALAARISAQKEVFSLALPAQ